MSILSEPSVTLCGFKSYTHHALCVIEVGLDGKHITNSETHNYLPLIYIERDLHSTFTPCKWYHTSSNINA